MKLLLVFLAALAVLASGYEIQTPLAARSLFGRSISSQVVDAIEAAKKQMPCGFPKMGIPPLAPLKLEHKDIKIYGDSLNLEASIDKLRVYGLDNFDIEEFRINPIFSKVTFKFRWHSVSMKSIYDFMMKMDNSNVLTEILRKGGAKLEVKDFVIWGTCKYSLGVIGSGGVHLKSFKLYAKVDEVNSDIENLSRFSFVNRKLNAILEEMIMLGINDNTENIAIISNDYVMPIINNLIGGKSLGDILGMIHGGGGGGSGNEPVEKEPCIPSPPEED